MKASLKEEKKLWAKGYKRVAGVDEVGRGPLAGPVVACAVIVKNPNLKIANVKDSKKLSAGQREKLYRILTNHPEIEWGIGAVSEKVIDRINIFQATRLAMKKAAQKLRDPSFLILDGRIDLDLALPQRAIIKADEKVFSCACASIIAKVFRDRLMKKYDKKYPFYGFAQNKGYPTLAHKRSIKKHGFSKIHRKTFNFV